QVLSGYTLGGADILRRAMGKKKEEEMALQRSVFVDGAAKKGVDKNVATRIFNLIELFAGYGFNKSHSAAYALLAYQTAWLKAQYPAAFMAAVFSSDMDNTDKSVILSEELNRMDVNLRPPSVNESEYKFSVADESTIRFGLGAIKGVGEGAIENIIMEREANGKFKDLFDFCKRIDLRKANKRVLEALIRSGAADELGPSRSVMMASMKSATQLAEQMNNNVSRGQDDMFGVEVRTAIVNSDENSAFDDNAFADAPDWDDHERLRGEKETLGFYFKGHPIMRYEQELAKIPNSYRLCDVRPGKVTVAGYIESIRMRSGSRGKTAEVRLDDRTARMQLTLYPEVNQRYRDILIKDKLIVVKGEAKEDDYKGVGYVIDTKEVFTLEQIRQIHANLKLRINEGMINNGVISDLQALLSSHNRGKSPVVIEYETGKASALLQFGETWKVNIDDHMLEELDRLLGTDRVELHYDRHNSGFE
ncbi:MAG: DNA polymerase-3 subunit alpha, partial [Planctomycetota bacterium]